MHIKEIQVTPTGVVIIDFINNNQDDTIYIMENRLLTALDSVGTSDGHIQQASKRAEESKEVSKYKETAVFALDTLLEYVKYLEDNGQLSYDLLKQRVDTYRKG